MNVLFIVIILATFGELGYGAAAVIRGDDTCPTECLQSNQPYFTHGLKPFHLNCTVGNQTEVKNFRESYLKRITHTIESFDAPKLVRIDFYHKRFKDGHYEGALNISFQLNEGKAVLFQNSIENNYRIGEYKYPPAVLLHFQSYDDPNYGDQFYYHNPIERIFRIWDPTQGPVTKRIGIIYDCIVGLDYSKPFRVYRIVLESAFGKTVTYNCTVAVQQGYEAGYMTDWLPTLATSFNPLNGTFHVVFSEFKGGITNETLRNISYNISLLKGDGTVVMSVRKYNPTYFDILFTGLENDIYNVNVEKCEVNMTGTFRNYILTTTTGTGSTVTELYDDANDPGSTVTELYDNANDLKMTILLTTVAVLLTVIATSLIYFTYLKRRGGQNNESREPLGPNYTDTLDADQMERDSRVLDAASINDTHETDYEKDNNSESNTGSNIAHCESAHSAGYDFYMNSFVEMNASRSTSSYDFRLQDTLNEIKKKHNNKRPSDNSLPSKTEHLTYDECMERFTKINASSTSSDYFASSENL